MLYLAVLAFWCLLSPAVVLAEVHTFYYNVTYLKANPDGVKEKTVIGFNNSWPLPNIYVNKGDRVQLYLTNGLSDSNTSLHFHGLFQRDANAMDGPEHVTQCPIAPGQTYLYNFTVEDQSGTYWYHSHTGNQYLDGLRGGFIIHDSEPEPFDFDEEVVLTISDWYHDSHKDLMKSFLNKYNPTGAEPVPQNALFNDSRNVTWEIKPNTTYFLRIASIAGFVSQYLYLEDHEFTVVEVDGVYVEPKITEVLYLTAAQRYGVLLKTKEVNPHKNYAFMQVFDDEMLDVILPDLELAGTNYLVYDSKASLPKPYFLDFEEIEPLNDFELTPFEKYPLLPDYDYQIVLNVEMLNLADGVNYAFFNNITYVPPKVPTLATVLSAPKDQIFNKQIYGSNTHNFILQKDDIVEIVINNHDDGKHPFHLHGHIFQVIQKSQAFEDDPVDYDEGDHEDFPDYPVIRDTVQVPGNGYMVLRFKADNPGVWFFHCHVDWHLEQGLAIVLIEDPEGLRDTQSLSNNFKETCEAVGVPYEGNAAGNAKDYTNLKNENVQPAYLPGGFTLKGYFAMIICIISALYGLNTIFNFGMEDTSNIDEDQIIKHLETILVQHDAIDESLLNN